MAKTKNQQNGKPKGINENEKQSKKRIRKEEKVREQRAAVITKIEKVNKQDKSKCRFLTKEKEKERK